MIGHRPLTPIGTSRSLGYDLKTTMPRDLSELLSLADNVIVNLPTFWFNRFLHTLLQLCETATP